MEEQIAVRRGGVIRELEDEGGTHALGVVASDRPLEGGRGQHLALHADQVVAVDRVRVLEPGDAPGLPLVLQHVARDESLRVHDGTA